MAKYEVVTSAGADFPVGMEFETDNLHPVMLQHVKQISGKAKPEAVAKEETPLTEAQLNKLHAEALKEDAKLFPPAKDKPAPNPAGGPGENS
jgi:hypothetical protein